MALNIFSTDGFLNEIYKHDGFSSSILDSFSSPGTTTNGLTFDGVNIYSVQGAALDKIYKHNGFSTSILDSFSSPELSPQGLTHEYIGC